jgi:hypothetical protein
MNIQKSIYVCGPLTELPADQQEKIKAFYSRIAGVAEKITGLRGFVPHEHYDPIKHANFTPAEVDAAERRQVRDLTSCLIAVPAAPSWGSGIEVEIANQSDVPVIILCESCRFVQKKISRLLRGNPAVKTIITYHTEEEALELLAKELSKLSG